MAVVWCVVRNMIHVTQEQSSHHVGCWWPGAWLSYVVGVYIAQCPSILWSWQHCYTSCEAVECTTSSSMEMLNHKTPILTILYQFKGDMALWKRLKCHQYMHRFWQTVATQHVWLGVLTHLPLDKMAANLADNFKCIFLNEKDRIPIQISLKFVPKSAIDNKPTLAEVMAWCQTGDKPLPEPMLTLFIDAYMRH